MNEGELITALRNKLRNIEASGESLLMEINLSFLIPVIVGSSDSDSDSDDFSD